MTSPVEDRRHPTTKSDPSVAELVDVLKGYALQETVEPLKGAGRWMGVGVAGALSFGIGGILLLLGLLRLLQTEWERTATGALSWVSYLIVLIIGGIAIALAATRIKKDFLGKQGK